MYRSVRYPNETSSESMILKLRNAWCSVMFGLMFCGRLRVSSSLQILTRLYSACSPNCNSSVNITLPQSYTVQLTCYRNRFNRGLSRKKNKLRVPRCTIHSDVNFSASYPFTCGRYNQRYHTCGGRFLIPFCYNSNISIFSCVVTLEWSSTGLRTNLWQNINYFRKQEITEW